MRKSYLTLQKEQDMDSLLSIALTSFPQIKDHRSQNIVYPLPSVLSSGLAMFSTKCPSLLQFEAQTKSSQENLRNLFSIQKLCSDSNMRKVLDGVSPSKLNNIFPLYKSLLVRLGIWKEYEYLGGFKIVAIDGVEHFHSKTVHCAHCLQRKHKNGQLSYHHQMLASTLVCPGKREVFPLYCEPIVKSDGATKNDCELNAAKRLFDWFENNYKNEKLLFVEDALSANTPHINRIRALNWDFIINAKPGSHSYLFDAFESRKKHNLLKQHIVREKDKELVFHWIPNISLNASNPDCMVNFLHLEERNLKTGKVQIFTSVTSLNIRKKNVKDISDAGRARWKIENETFNTLKNQGYHFEHNYGHGKDSLASNLAILMMIAFLIDQILQKCSLVFKAIWRYTKTKIKIWITLMSFFTVMIFESFNQLYNKIADAFSIQIE